MTRKPTWSGAVGCLALVAACGGVGEAMPDAASDRESIEITRHELTTSDGLRLHYARLGASIPA